MKKDPFLVLGIPRTASQEEKLAAWKKARSLHHPDKGGDPEKFKRMKEAWEEIKDLPPQSDRRYTTDDVHNGFFHNRRAHHFVNIDATISIRQAVEGGKHFLSIQLAHGKDTHQIAIDVPVGVQDGETVRYPRLLLGNIDVNVTFNILKDKIWSIEGLNLVKRVEVSIWDLILGTIIDVETIGKGKVRVTIPPMSQPESRLRIRSYGIVNRQNFMQKGDMMVQLAAQIPREISPELLEIIKQERR